MGGKIQCNYIICNTIKNMNFCCSYETDHFMQIMAWTIALFFVLFLRYVNVSCTDDDEKLLNTFLRNDSRAGFDVSY